MDWKGLISIMSIANCKLQLFISIITFYKKTVLCICNYLTTYVTWYKVLKKYRIVYKKLFLLKWLH